MLARRGRSTAPSSGCSSPVINRKMVVLPAPLGPTRPTFSPGLSWNEASTNRICAPYCLLTVENEIMARLRSEALDQLADAVDEGVPLMALPLLPGAERGGVGDPVDEQLAVEVIDLVLEGAGGQPLHDPVDRLAVAVDRAQPDRDVAGDQPAQVGHAQAALVVVEGLVADRLEHRVDQHGERDLR